MSARPVRDFSQQILVHELSNQLNWEDVQDVMDDCGLPCPITLVIAALKERIALRREQQGKIT